MFAAGHAREADGGGGAIRQKLGERAGIFTRHHRGQRPRRRGMIRGERAAALPKCSFPISLQWPLPANRELDERGVQQTIGQCFGAKHSGFPSMIIVDQTRRKKS